MLDGSTVYEFQGCDPIELAGGHFMVVPPGMMHRGEQDLRMPTTLIGIVLAFDARGATRNTPFTVREQIEVGVAVGVGALPGGDRYEAARLIEFLVDRQALFPAGTDRRMVGHRHHVEIEMISGVGIGLLRLSVAIDGETGVEVNAAEVDAAIPWLRQQRPTGRLEVAGGVAGVDTQGQFIGRGADLELNTAAIGALYLDLFGNILRSLADQLQLPGVAAYRIAALVDRESREPELPVAVRLTGTQI